MGALFGQNSSTSRPTAEVMTYLLLTVIGALVTAAAAPAFATERVEWKGDPILIQLSTGFERRVIVRGATGISIGIPDTATQYLHAQSIGDSFWLTANAPIDSARIILKIHPDGSTVVAEVSSIPDFPPPGNLFIAIPTDQSAAESPIEKRPRLCIADALGSPAAVFARAAQEDASRSHTPFRRSRSSQPVPLRPESAHQLWRCSGSDAAGRLAYADALCNRDSPQEYDRKAGRAGSA